MHAKAGSQSRRIPCATLLAIGFMVIALLAPQSVAPAAAAADDYLLVNRQTNECLQVPAASWLHAARVRVGKCSSLAFDIDKRWSRNQWWSLEPVGVEGGYPVYRLRVLSSNMCLDVAHFGAHNGAQVVQAYCGDGRNQRWRLTPTSGGHFQLVALHSQKCLDKAWGGDVVQWSCHAGHWQQWRTDDGDFGLMTITSFGQPGQHP